MRFFSRRHRHYLTLESHTTQGVRQSIFLLPIRVPWHVHTSRAVTVGNLVTISCYLTQYVVCPKRKSDLSTCSISRSVPELLPTQWSACRCAGVVLAFDVRSGASRIVYYRNEKTKIRLNVLIVLVLRHAQRYIILVGKIIIVQCCVCSITRLHRHHNSAAPRMPPYVPAIVASHAAKTQLPTEASESRVSVSP